MTLDTLKVSENQNHNYKALLDSESYVHNFYCSWPWLHGCLATTSLMFSTKITSAQYLAPPINLLQSQSSGFLWTTRNKTFHNVPRNPSQHRLTK